MKIFSTFSGIGGFEIGIQSAVESNRKAQQANANSGHSANDKGDPLQERRQSATCVGYSEIDKYAIKVYEKQFGGECENCRLARERERNSSTSRGQETLNSERTRLPQTIWNNDNTQNERSESDRTTCEHTPKNFGDITQIKADELPDFDCLVGGFPCQAFSIAGKRKGFEDTRGTLFFDLARILRAKQPRLFVFENVKGLLSHDGGRTFKTIIEAIDELGYDCQWQVLNSKNHGVPQNRERVYIVGHLRGTPRPEVFPLTSDDGKDSRLSGHISNTLTARYEGAQAVGTYIGEGELNAQKIRRLTPIECERLQGFPDNWTAEGIDGAISDTQRYKMCGNAVTTNVVQAVFERILK